MTNAKPAYAIIVCSRCRSPIAGALAAQELIAELRARPAAAGFTIETVACMAGCDRPLAVAFTAPGKASFLFGDIEPQRDADALLNFGDLYAGLDNGWCNEGQRPAGLKGKILARIPALASGT